MKSYQCSHDDSQFSKSFMNEPVVKGSAPSEAQTPTQRKQIKMNHMCVNNSKGYEHQALKHDGSQS